MELTTFVGLDLHKRATSVAIAEYGRGGEVRFLGEIPGSPCLRATNDTDMPGSSWNHDRINSCT